MIFSEIALKFNAKSLKKCCVLKVLYEFLMLIKCESKHVVIKSDILFEIELCWLMLLFVTECKGNTCCLESGWGRLMDMIHSLAETALSSAYYVRLERNLMNIVLEIRWCFTSSFYRRTNVAKFVIGE
jgi:hypothetical protein